MKKAVALIALLASSSAAFAVGQPTPVPEISALEGVAALAFIATVVALVWERRRRAS